MLWATCPPSFLKVLKKYMPTLKHKFNGMPSLEGLKRVVSFAERLPNGLFYFPVGIRWLLLVRAIQKPYVTNGFESND